MGYSEVIKELTDKGVTPEDGEYYEFTGFPLESEFQLFFEFGQEYLDREDLLINIKPARLFFNTNTTINALACKKHDYFIIEIFKGTLFWAHTLFLSFNEKFKSAGLERLNDLALARNIKPGYLLFQVFTLYCFYHEAGHLFQRGKEEKDYLEFLTHDCEGNDIRIRHMRELDADWHSAHCLAMHIIEFSEDNIDGEKKINFEMLLDVSAMALSVIYIFFVEQSKNFQDLYFEEHCHPHPSVRLCYMVRFFLDNLKGNIGDKSIDEKAVLNKTFEICTSLMQKENEENIITKYSKQLLEQLDPIEVYVRNIIKNTDSYPNLVVHL